VASPWRHAPAGTGPADPAAADPQPLRAGRDRPRSLDRLPISDSDALAWIAFAILVAVALLGWTMFAIWWQRRQARAEVAPASTPGLPAEQRFPVSIVTLPGLLAVTTVVLVFLAAVGV
jgi:hypothetical protein